MAEKFVSVSQESIDIVMDGLAERKAFAAANPTAKVVPLIRDIAGRAGVSFSMVYKIRNRVENEKKGLDEDGLVVFHDCEQYKCNGCGALLVKTPCVACFAG